MAEFNVPNSPMIGQTIEGQTQQAAPIPDDEVSKSPEFKQNLKWLQKPENLMTALVFVGSMMQDRQRGQSKMDAFAERSLGTLGFRGELGRRNAADVAEAAKAKSEADYKAGQIGIGRERNVLEREGLGVQREQIGATKENTRAQISGQERMNTQDNQTQWNIALLEDSWRRYTASLELELGKLKEGGAFGLSPDQINDVFKNYADAAANGIMLPEPPEQLKFHLRMQVGTNPQYQQMVGYRVYDGKDGRKYVDVSPEWRGLLGIPGEGNEAAPAQPAATAQPAAKPRVERKPPPANAMGVVDKSKLPPVGYKGTPYNPGVKPTPRPEDKMTFEEYLRRGQ